MVIVLSGFVDGKVIPMKLDLIALKNRCLRANRLGWAVSSSSQFVAELEAKLGRKLDLPRRIKAGSPAHLVALIDAVQENRVVPEPVAVLPEPELEELVEAKVDESKKLVEVELADEPELEEGEELEVLTYGEMSYQQLVDEARDRGLPGRRGMSKIELLEMLEQDDKN